jgi:DNA polymerase-3 subunit epsilon
MILEQRQIVLDTETTGLRTEDGHRIIEVAAVEMMGRKLTGNYFHRYINPERNVEEAAFAIHGISNAFLADKPLFAAIASELLDFIKGAELIIHNAPFDLGFLDYELMLAQQNWKKITEYCSVVDTLVLARRLHVGQRNTLDALCKRYTVDLSKREMHGALLDARLLAQVYLAMTGGQGNFFDRMSETPCNSSKGEHRDNQPAVMQSHQLIVLQASEAELSEHQHYLNLLKAQGKCLWETNA